MVQGATQVRAHPFGALRAGFPAPFNKVERDTSRRVGPGDALAYTIVLENMGTDVATDVRLQLSADEGIERVRVRDKETELSIGEGGTIALDTLEPGVSRVLHVDGRVAAVIDDQTQLRLRAALLTAQLPRVELGAPVHAVASRPRFSAVTSRIAVEQDEVLRPNRISTFRLILANEGTDRGRDVRVALHLPDELRLERVDDATRDGNVVILGDIPAGETREASLQLRLVGVVAGDHVLISGRVGGMNVVPFALASIELMTHAEASFAEGATLTAVPAETVDAGAEIAYTLSLRNCGDGAARRLTATVAGLKDVVYAPGSTTINGFALQDYAGTSPLLGPVGLMLADVAAGVEVIARWRVIVNTPLPPQTVIETVASVRWDDVNEISVASPPIRVRSTSAMPIVEPALPFSVLGAVAAPTRTTTLSRSDLGTVQSATYVELRPAVPVRAGQGGSNGYGMDGGSIPTIEYARLPPGNDSGGNHESPRTSVFLELSDDHLGWVVQYLEQTRVGGLVAHLLALRALFPDRVGGADRLLRARLRSHREMLAELADRLFIKVRLPDFKLAPDDVETAELRSSLVALVEELAERNPERASLRSGLRLVESLDGLGLAASLQMLAKDNLATAAPWKVMAMLIGTTLERDGGVVCEFTAYRDALVGELTHRSGLDATGFEASLREPVDPMLDELRESMVRALAEQQRVLN